MINQMQRTWVRLTILEALRIVEALNFAVGFIDGTDRTACVDTKGAMLEMRARLVALTVANPT